MGAHGNMYILLDTGSYKENNQILTNWDNTHLRALNSQTVRTLRRLIFVCAVCLCLTNRIQGLNGFQILCLKDK